MYHGYIGLMGQSKYIDVLLTLLIGFILLFMKLANPNVVCRVPNDFNSCSCAEGWQSVSRDEPTNCIGKLN